MRNKDFWREFGKDAIDGILAGFLGAIVLIGALLWIIYVRP